MAKPRTKFPIPQAIRKFVKRSRVKRSASTAGMTIRERVTNLEAHDRELMGNGQPGIVAKLSDQVSKQRDEIAQLKLYMIIFVIADIVSRVASTGPVSGLLLSLVKWISGS